MRWGSQNETKSFALYGFYSHYDAVNRRFGCRLVADRNRCGHDPDPVWVHLG